MKISVFAVDLAKHQFEVRGYGAGAELGVSRRLSRAGMKKFFSTREERCEVVMEACATAHYWGRWLQAQGHRVRLLPAQHVRPYVVGNKTDAHDAAAIYEASRRSGLRAVPVKTVAQQDLKLVHLTRERLIAARTALVNQVRGVLAERGVVFGRGLGVLRRGVQELLGQPPTAEVSGLLQTWLRERLQEWDSLAQQVKACERELTRQYAASAVCAELGRVEGVGVMTATALVASVGDGRQFHNARQFAAWVGLTPKEHSSGSRRRLGGISKRGDAYLRKLLVHGARSVVRIAGRKTDPRSQWVNRLVARRGHNRAVVALANKNTRIVWVLLSRGECYRPVLGA